jgi:drug/metabolite transporter (DMT)-like permease
VTLPASAQYPFVTGGTMIVSTAISMFTDKKPNKKEIFAVLLAFVGLILLFAIPEIKIF